MRRTLLVLLLSVFLMIGCSHQETSQPFIQSTAHNFPQLLAYSPELTVWSEKTSLPAITQLLPDPQEGVWGGQDGELFHFKRLSDDSFGRISCGRPVPDAVWLGNLVWLKEGQLAGRVVTSHLVRMTPDGKVTDVISGRSPGGVPFDSIDVRDGRLYLHDETGAWYHIPSGGAKLEPVQEFFPNAWSEDAPATAAQQKHLEEQFKGLTQIWPVTLPDETVYGLVRREQLFLFDVDQQTFSLLGDPVAEQSGPAPVGSLDGQMIAREGEHLLLLDTKGTKLKEFKVGETYGTSIYDESGWVYLLPSQAVNLKTGQRRSWDHFLPGAVSAITRLKDGHLVGGTAHGGLVFTFDPATGDRQMWGRPLPELGAESGEEVAPIDGLAAGKDGYIYGSIGSGARGTAECHLFRMDTTGKVTDQIHVDEPIRDLVTGADGYIYGIGKSQVVVLQLP